MSEAKPAGASQITLSQLMQPEHANSRGDVHGGWIMKLVDEAGALAAMRHAQSRVVTVAIDQMTFDKPVNIGDLIILEAEVTYVGRTSIETRVAVTAENPIDGVRKYTNTAYLVYVALDARGTPQVVPPLLIETDHQREQHDAGARRQAHRLAMRNQERENQRSAQA